jgi:hypothetical protein
MKRNRKKAGEMKKSSAYCFAVAKADCPSNAKINCILNHLISALLQDFPALLLPDNGEPDRDRTLLYGCCGVFFLGDPFPLDTPPPLNMIQSGKFHSFLNEVHKDDS